MNAVLRGLLDLPEEKRTELWEQIQYLAKEYTRIAEEGGGINAAYSFHGLIDDQVAKTKIAQEASCKKGCSFCCHIRVEINNDEADMLIDYAKEQNITIDKERLLKQKGLKEWDFGSLPQEDSACVFLKEGECSVYEHRPAACRKYFVASDPKYCDLTHPGENVQVIVNFGLEVLFAATGLGAAKIGSMPDLLLERL